jgi:glycosyltransferase involved in cell wall biosynthesis
MYDLAKTGHLFDILRPETRTLWGSGWDEAWRPIPDNVNIIGGIEDIPFLDLRQYDLLLAQSYADLLCIQFSSRPRLLLVMSPEPPQAEDLGKGDAMRLVYREWRLASVRVIYACGYFAHTWGLPGTIIPHGVDASDYEGFQSTGQIPAVLTVANFIKERGDFMGYNLHRDVVKDDVPHKIVGLNPSLPDSGPARDWAELKSYYRDYRVYLNTSIWSIVAMMEAMTVGMPIVTRPGPREGSPEGIPSNLLTNGYNGFVSDDPQYLREKTKSLLANPDVAKEMGQRARETVQAKHNIDRFIREWNEAFDNAISQSEAGQVGNLPGRVYEVAGLVSDPKASFGRAIFSPVGPAEEPVLYGPWTHLPEGWYKIAFYLRLGGDGGPEGEYGEEGLHRESGDVGPGRVWSLPLAILDVCTEAGQRAHARYVVRGRDFALGPAYHPFLLYFYSEGERDFEFRVHSTGASALLVDPYRTWNSIQRLGSKGW